MDYLKFNIINHIELMLHQTNVIQIIKETIHSSKDTNHPTNGISEHRKRPTAVQG